MKREGPAKTSGIVTLITDFGYRGEYGGAMKGAILKVNPHCQVVDITHQITPQNIREAAFVLAKSYSYFPAGTVHVVVVDPGVGSERRPVVLKKGEHRFVGPDNGVFSLILAARGPNEGYEITRKLFFLSPVSRTFHGRDIFAPVAGHLSMGVQPRDVGPRIRDFVRVDWPRPRKLRQQFIGQILWSDSFGNLITNLSRKDFEALLSNHPFEILGRKLRIEKIHPTYSQGPPRKPMALFGSSGFLEIAINQGNAEKELRLKAGDEIIITFGKKDKG